MARPILTTDRLELRPMTPAHLPLHHQLDSDPEAMRYLLGRARTPQEIDQYWTPHCADTVADAAGIGWWVGFLGDQCVGWWDLSPSKADLVDGSIPTEAQAGWRVLRSQWGRGLATEGAAILLQHAFETVGLKRVWAETMAVNAPSRRVMEKIGMRHLTTTVRQWDDPLPGAELGEVIYEITEQEWTGAVARAGSVEAVPGDVDST